MIRFGLKLKVLFLLFVGITGGFSKQLSGQISSGLFLIPENFQTQMVNPAFMRADKAQIIAFPGFAGFTLMNSGNMQFSDFIYRQGNGTTVVDFNRFSDRGKEINSLGQSLNLPLFYITLPVKKGVISIYLKEHLNNISHFPKNAVLWFDQGNFPENSRDYNSGKINLTTLGYHELAVGMAKRVNDKVTAGLRGKLLLGQMYIDLNNWNYAFDTSPSGDEIFLNSSGGGKISIPFRLVKNEAGRVQQIKVEETFKKYFATLNNPGLALDFGIDYKLNEKSQISASITDLGFIWFQNNGYNLELNESYLFKGFDVSNSVDSKTSGYVSPFNVVVTAQHKLRNVFQPLAKSTRFVQGVIPKTFLQYKYSWSRNLAFGISNQTFYQKENVKNILSLSSLQSFYRFSFFENISLYGKNNLCFGGGIQWTNSYSQIFLASDNILAAYHPANQKSYTFSVGANLLLNQEKKKLYYNRSATGNRGKVSNSRPFFRKRK